MMTVKELRDRLDDFGDHLPVSVLVNEDMGIHKTIDSMETENIGGDLTVVLYLG